MENLSGTQVEIVIYLQGTLDTKRSLPYFLQGDKLESLV